ncbi:MAG: alpha/beta fold hydrolase [Bacillota bacterium]
MRFDFRGSGDSPGEFEEMTVSGEVEDALAALAFARERVGRSVALLGLSLGGAVATLAAVRDGDVAAMVLWAAVAHPARLAQFMAAHHSGEPSVLMWQGHFDLGGNLVGRAFVEELPRHQPLAAAAQYRGPVLVVHGTRDQSVPPMDATAYMQAFPGPDKTLHLVAGADHTFNRASWEHEVISTTVAWLKARLLERA